MLCHWQLPMCQVLFVWREFTWQPVTPSIVNEIPVAIPVFHHFQREQVNNIFNSISSLFIPSTLTTLEIKWYSHNSEWFWNNLSLFSGYYNFVIWCNNEVLRSLCFKHDKVRTTYSESHGHMITSDLVIIPGMAY